jgi:Fur family ferric uptake transcriptional regulator
MKAEDILKHFNLKNTGCRKHILAELICADGALSENEIKMALPDLFDRVTFYRSLKTLCERNIIHKIVLNDISVKYALNKEIYMHNHAHFHCKVCDRVSCVDIGLNGINLPDYTVQSVQVMLEGVCPVCQ